MRRLGSGDAPDHMPSADAAAGTSATCYQLWAMQASAPEVHPACRTAPLVPSIVNATFENRTTRSSLIPLP